MKIVEFDNYTVQGDDGGFQEEGTVIGYDVHYNLVESKSLFFPLFYFPLNHNFRYFPLWSSPLPPTSTIVFCIIYITVNKLAEVTITVSFINIL